MKKEQLAEQYAEEQNSAYTNDYYGFLAGYEAGESKWINVEDNLPETDYQHRDIYESKEVLLDCGDFHVVSRYIKKGIHTGEGFKVLWSGFDNIEDQRVVERWTQIPR
jgi:hypothetical protein